MRRVVVGWIKVNACWGVQKPRRGCMCGVGQNQQLNFLKVVLHINVQVSCQ